MDNLPEFFREIDEFEASIPVIHQRLQVELLVEGYDQVIERSPVRTGAYRAEHVLAEGDAQPTALLYEAPNRPGPDRILPSGEPPIDPPSVSEAAGAVEGAPPFRHLWVFNQRFYASYLEHGTATMAPRLIYQSAEDHVRARAEALAVRG